MGNKKIIEMKILIQDRIDYYTREIKSNAHEIAYTIRFMHTETKKHFQSDQDIKEAVLQELNHLKDCIEE